MRKFITGNIVRSLSAVALAASLASEGSPETVSGAAPPPGQAWMPDVAPRLAELKERTEAAAAEARSRRAGAGSAGQWWRFVAARPAGETGR